MKKAFIPILLLLSSLSLPLAAQSLYGSGISPESALVRVIFTEQGNDLELEIGSAVFTQTSPETSRMYHPVSPGMYFFELGGEWIEVIPMSGKYYTLIIAGNQCLVFEDEEHSAPAKSQVYFYNALNNENASLIVSQTGDELFTETAAGKSSQRAINPMDIEFAIATVSGRRTELGSLPMSRGGSTTIALLEIKGELKTLIFEASVRKES